MSKNYPALGIELIGEPGHVRDLANKLTESAGEIEGASFPAMKIVTDRLDGPTRQRAHLMVAEMQGSVDDISGSLENSAENLHKWAGEIEKYRGEFDELEDRLVKAESERADVSLKLYTLAQIINRGGAKPEQQLEYEALSDRLFVLDQTIRGIEEAAERKLEDYEDKADEVGSSLQTDSLSSPAASEGQRFLRQLLSLSSGLGKALDVGGYLTLLTGGLGALGKKAVKEALDKVQQSIEKALLAGATGKFAVDASATVGGAGVSPGQIIFEAINLAGIGPLKGKLLNKIGSEGDRLALGEALSRVEARLKEDIFPEPRPAHPSPRP